MNNGVNGWWKWALAAVLAALVVPFGCEPDEMDDTDDVALDDVGEEPDESFEIEDRDAPVPFQDEVDTEYGHPDVGDGVPADDEVRVGRIDSEDTGFTGIWSHCRQGDFVLESSEIAVCVQEESTNRTEVYTGGKLVDVRRQGQDPDDEQTMDLLMPLLIDLQTASAEKVEVVRDGSDGMAVLRVTGTEMDIAQISGVTGNRFQDSSNLTVETEYRLEPGGEIVEIFTQLTPSSGERTHTVGDWYAYGDRAAPWTPGEGFERGSDFPWLGGVGDGFSYALIYDDDASPLGIADQFDVPYAELRYDNVTMSSSEPGTYRRWFAVGDGTVDSIRRLAKEARGEEFVDETATITLIDDGEDPIEDARLVLYDDDEAVTAGWTDSDGTVDLAVEPGSYDVEITGVAGSSEWNEEVEVDDGEGTIEIPQLVDVSFEITDADSSDGVNSRVTLRHDDVDTWFEYAMGGTVETTVPAGEVEVMVTAGMEYDLYREDHHFESGQQYDEQIELVRGVDTDGWRSGDFHQHLEPSLDSRLHIDGRVKENAAAGVELVVPTDHDIVSDLSPAIERLGLDDEMSTFPGVEISPLYAHYNLYPVPYRPEERGRGTIPLAQLGADDDVHLPRMPEVIETARGFDTDPVVQMNHPRNNSGMMAHVDYDPDTDPADVDHDDWVYHVDTIEVINRYGDTCQVASDWMGLLNVGERVTGLGNSDSHHANAEAGVPRNYMQLDLGPHELEPDPVRDVLREGRVTVASHAFLEVDGAGMPGDYVDVDDGTAEFDVSVQTPDWSHVNELFVIVNGSVVETIERSKDVEDRFDFEETIEVDVDEDSWVVFWADGPPPTEPLPRTRRVIAFTNPVYLNTGGDWEAPGPQSLDLEPIDTGYCDW